MKHKNEIWEMYDKFYTEKEIVQFKKEEGKSIEGHFPIHYIDVVIEESDLDRIVNTLGWLTKYIYDDMDIEDVTKPTNDELLEAINLIGKNAKNLQQKYNRFSDEGLREGLRKKARNRMLCFSYYKNLIESGFFEDKTIN